MSETLTQISKRRSKGVTFFALLLIVASGDQLSGQSNFANYHFMFQDLSFPFLILRYCGSLFLRAAGIFIGFEILLLREWARRLIMGLAVYHIITAFWRHPYSVFYKVAIWNEHKQLGLALPPGTDLSSGYPIWQPAAELPALTYAWMPLFLTIYFILLDLCFNGFILWFFTRPKVKAQFQ